ncbi:MAG: hypothetical protein HXY25_01260 [Alphaproteobacteria bacterium]|nr:hypothetical protein [Alphaproteobacteria bacterium]
MPEATPSTLLTAYRALSSCLAPLAPALLRARAARGKEEPARMAERLGRPVRPRPAGRLVWIHGASVGEALAVQPLIAALVRHWPDLAVLLTTQTVTGARVMEGRLRAPAFHQYAPIDTPGAVSGFLDHWRPDLAIWLESELWPNALEALRKRSVPALLVNARLSGRSREGWARRPRAARALLSTFAAMLAVDAATAQTLTRLAGRPARHLGNLKLAANPLQADETALV